MTNSLSCALHDRMEKSERIQTDDAGRSDVVQFGKAAIGRHFVQSGQAGTGDILLFVQRSEIKNDALSLSSSFFPLKPRSPDCWTRTHTVDGGRRSASGRSCRRTSSCRALCAGRSRRPISTSNTAPRSGRSATTKSRVTVNLWHPHFFFNTQSTETDH